MTKKPCTLSTERIRQAAALERRSTLYRWMAANHDEFAAVIAEVGRPNWRALATAFSEEGLRDRLGKPPSPEGTRLTWFKVRKSVQAQRTKRPKLQPAPKPSPPPALPTPVTEPRAETGSSRADEQIARMERLFHSRKGKMPDPL
jgi:hypothetical protein